MWTRVNIVKILCMIPVRMCRPSALIFLAGCTCLGLLQHFFRILGPLPGIGGKAESVIVM